MKLTKHGNCSEEFSGRRQAASSSSKEKDLLFDSISAFSIVLLLTFHLRHLFLLYVL